MECCDGGAGLGEGGQDGVDVGGVVCPGNRGGGAAETSGTAARPEVTARCEAVLWRT